MDFWLRSATLQIGGNRYSMDDLAFDFEVPFEDSDELTTATVNAYNLSANTRNSIKKGDPVIINAGYEGDLGVIFVGQVSGLSHKHSSTEWTTKITATEALDQWLTAQVNKTYTKSIKAKAMVQDLLNIFGIEVGTFELAIDKEYLNKLDHLMKEGFRFRYYGRYMDDFYIIHESKDTLRAAWKAISEHLAERGLELNDKTQIFPLRNGLDFLGFHSYLTDTGKVVRKLRRASRERMKRKLRKYKVMYESGAITKEKITESYQSWRSHASHGDCHALIQKYDQLYNEIFERSETADVSINQRPAR